MIQKEIGKKIYIRRKELGYTQEEIGKKMGVYKSTVSRWEKGGTSSIKKAQLEMIAKILHVDPTYLFSWEHAPVPEDANVIKIRDRLISKIEKISDLSDLEKIETFIKAFIK